VGAVVDVVVVPGTMVGPGLAVVVVGFPVVAGVVVGGGS
jgi:hypothetical protein